MSAWGRYPGKLQHNQGHPNLLIEHLTLLDGLGDFSGAIAGVPASKLRSLASQAMSLDAANLREILPEKRYTLIVALLCISSFRDAESVGI